MRIDRTYQEWVELREKYYNGDTTMAEERDLANFVLNAPEAQIPEFDADRAVFAYLFTGKKVQQTTESRVNRRIGWCAAASVVVLAVAGLFFSNIANADKCMMSIDGQAYYAEDLVAQQMDRNLAMVLQDFTTVEDELSVMFSD